MILGGNEQPLECQQGISGASKNSRKNSIFSQLSTVRAYVNRASNLYKIGLKGYDFVGDLTYSGLFFMENLCHFKGIIFGNLLYLGSFAKFCDVFLELCV